VHNKCHLYGWADTYLLTAGKIKIGYGSVWGKDRREDRDTIFEFYLLHPYRKFSGMIFSEFLSLSQVQWIECQTNDYLLSSMLFEFAENINTEAILFEDGYQTSFKIPGAVFRKDDTENNNPSDSGEYMLEYNGETVATGGFLLNYNFPYADIYMEVKEQYRRQGFGSLLIQELKKEIYSLQRVPAARCNVRNAASKASLQKAGFKPCGFWLTGKAKSLNKQAIR